jgi:hypothetical protein
VSANSQSPSAQLAAGHIPADLIPYGADPRTVVIVQQAPRSYTGAVGVVMTLCLLLQVATTTATAVAAAAPAGVGVSFALRRGK